MPFLPINSTIQSAAKLPPIYIIPGIFGYGSELNALANALNDQYKGARPIYVYYDPRISNPDSFPEMELNTAEHIQMIADEISTYSPPTFPRTIIGYSYGCTLATKSAQHLKRLDIDCGLYLIDGVSPESSRKYFETSRADSTKDLVNILCYAANLAELPTATITFTEEEINLIAALPLEERITEIANRILQHQARVSEDSNYKFSSFIKMARCDLRQLHCDKFCPELNNDKLAEISLLLTDKTTKKHRGAGCGGWDSYAENVLLESDSLLRQEEHQSLLKLYNAESLAKLISAYIKSRVQDMRAFLSTVIADAKHQLEVQAIPGHQENLELMEILHETITKINSRNNSPKSSPLSLTPPGLESPLSILSSDESAESADSSSSEEQVIVSREEISPSDDEGVLIFRPDVLNDENDGKAKRKTVDEQFFGSSFELKTETASRAPHLAFFKSVSLHSSDDSVRLVHTGPGGAQK